MNLSAQPHPPAGPANEDRLLAAGAHLGWAVGFPFVAPLVIYMMKKDQSRFVAFHALQAVIWSIISMALLLLLLFASLTVPLALTLAARDERVMGVTMMWTWAAMLVPWGIFLPFSCVAAIKAYQGEEYELPIAGRLARRRDSQQARSSSAGSCALIIGVLLLIGAIVVTAGVFIAIKLRHEAAEPTRDHVIATPEIPKTAAAENTTGEGDSIGVAECDRRPRRRWSRRSGRCAQPESRQRLVPGSRGSEPHARPASRRCRATASRSARGGQTRTVVRRAR